MVLRRRWTLVLASVCSLLLASCDTSAPPPPPDRVDLEGLWLVTPEAGTFYGSGGTTTLEFGAAASGGATFLSRSDANDITTCERHVYAALSENVVLLDGEFYEADASADQIVLEAGTDRLTLTRVSGAPPVAPCAEANAIEVGTFDVSVGSFSLLNAFATRLYFNIDDATDSIIAYDTATGTLGAPRAYSDSVLGGTHRWVVGVRSDTLFYGHCGCGGSTSLDHFDLSLNTSLVSVEVDSGLGVNLGVRYGYFAGTTVVVGGRDRDDFTKNDLLTLNADTLALVSQRQVLDGADIDDIAFVDGRLLALVGDSIVVIGADGRADETIKLQGIASAFPRGLTAIGSSVYVLDATATDEAVLFEVALP